MFTNCQVALDMIRPLAYRDKLGGDQLCTRPPLQLYIVTLEKVETKGKGAQGSPHSTQMGVAIVLIP